MFSVMMGRVKVGSLGFYSCGSETIFFCEKFPIMEVMFVFGRVK